jgi:hypothetical protein
LFGKICNLITTRSDQYSVQVVGQSVFDADHDGTVNLAAGDKVLSQARIERLVDRRELTDDDPNEGTFILAPIE